MSTSTRLILSSLQQAKTTDPHREIKLFTVDSHKPEIILPPSVCDFVLSQHESTLDCASGEEGVRSIVQHPHCSLYCFDFTQRRAWFVKTKSNEDLYTAPFLYLAQLKHATHVYTIPLELLEKVLLQEQQPTAANTFAYKHDLTSLVSDEQVLFLFSTGRCGSTLLCKVLGKIDGVLGLQEPEPFTSLAGLRNAGGASDDEIITCLRLCLVSHCRPHHKNVKKWIFKLQSQMTEIMDLFPRAFPNAQNLFMYRSAEGVTKSIAKMMPSLEDELIEQQAHLALYTGLKWLPGEKKYGRDLAVIYWLTTVEKTLEFIKAGVKVVCVRYEELVAKTEQTVRELSSRFGLPLTEENVQRVLDVMKSPSQEGAFTVFEHQGLDQVLQEMHKLVAEHRAIGSGHYILPHTIFHS